MLTKESFLQGIETYLATTGMKPTVFGKQVMDDPKFVFDLRNGRSPSFATVAKCHEFIRENPAGQGAGK